MSRSSGTSSQRGGSPDRQPKVAIVDGQLHPYHDFAMERERWEDSGFDVHLGACRTEAELMAMAHDADAIAFWDIDVPLTRNVIEQLSRCRIIVRYGTGIDSVDVSAATDKGILVAIPAGYCTREVAEHATALLLSLSRRLPFLDRHIRDGGWRGGSSLTGGVHRLARQTLGLIGFGRIAQQVAENLKPMIGSILAHDPFVQPAIATRLGVDLVDLDHVLTESDLLSVHVPLTAETHKLIGHDELAKLKPSAFLVNTSRGNVIDEDSLIAALEKRQFSGAGLDVFSTTPLPEDSPLRGLDNVVLTPHFAGNSEESKAELYEAVTHIIEEALGGRVPAGVLNAEADTLNEVRESSRGDL